MRKTKTILRLAAVAGLLALVGWSLYADIFQSPFIFDDKNNITENPSIRLTALTPEQLLRIADSPSPRPFANFTFAVNYYFHDYRVNGYHLVNLLIHIITAVLVFLIAGQTLDLLPVKTRGPIPLLAAILLWAAVALVVAYQTVLFGPEGLEGLVGAW